MLSMRRVFRVERKEISYLRYTLESYDGMALVRTIDPHAALVEVLISPGCEHLVLELIESLKTEEGLRLEAL
jgi:hypothetical protein